MASSHRDYVPQNTAQFNEFMQKLVHYAEVNTGGTAPGWDIALARQNERAITDARSETLTAVIP